MLPQKGREKGDSEPCDWEKKKTFKNNGGGRALTDRLLAKCDLSLAELDMLLGTREENFWRSN